MKRIQLDQDIAAKCEKAEKSAIKYQKEIANSKLKMSFKSHIDSNVAWKATE